MNYIYMCCEIEKINKNVIILAPCRLRADGKGATWHPAVQPGLQQLAICALCHRLPREADDKEVGMQTAKKPIDAGPTRCWPIEADYKDGEGSRRERCGGKETTKPPFALTEASPVGCRLNLFADCSVSDTDGKELCRLLSVG